MCMAFQRHWGNTTSTQVWGLTAASSWLDQLRPKSAGQAEVPRLHHPVWHRDFGDQYPDQRDLHPALHRAGAGRALGHLLCDDVPLHCIRLCIFLFRQFFRSSPDSIIHAARVDGFSEIEIILRLILPSVVAAIAAFSI